MDNYLVIIVIHRFFLYEIFLHSNHKMDNFDNNFTKNAKSNHD